MKDAYKTNVMFKHMIEDNFSTKSTMSSNIRERTQGEITAR
jgi:hypothetical protein